MVVSPRKKNYARNSPMKNIDSETMKTAAPINPVFGLLFVMSLPCRVESALMRCVAPDHRPVRPQLRHCVFHP